MYKSQFYLKSQISIFIGENGCGKSTFISHLANEINTKNKVIAIASTPYNKFKISSINDDYHYIGQARSKNTPAKILKEAFSSIEYEDERRFKLIYRSLEYIGYKPRIGFKVIGLDPFFPEILTESDLIDFDKKSLLKSILKPLSNFVLNESSIWVGDNSIYESGFGDLYLSELLSFEQILKKLKIIKSIEIYLDKNDKIIPLSKGSSGELSLLESITYICAHIDENTTIVIDEPENSLHPKWQKDYVNFFVESLYHYHPKMIIATHSPLIISGISNNSSYTIYEVYDDELNELDLNSINAEYIYQELFHLITPQNRNLSNECVTILNNAKSKSISKRKGIEIIENFKTMSFDSDQIEFLNGIIKIIEQMK